MIGGEPGRARLLEPDERDAVCGRCGHRVAGWFADERGICGDCEADEAAVLALADAVGVGSGPGEIERTTT